MLRIHAPSGLSLSLFYSRLDAVEDVSIYVKVEKDRFFPSVYECPVCGFMYIIDAEADAVLAFLFIVYPSDRLSLFRTTESEHVIYFV